MNLLKFNENLIAPKKSYHGDAGFDIFLLEDTTILGRDAVNKELSEQYEMEIRGVTVVPTGFGMVLEHDEYAQFFVRSSIAKMGIMLPLAVVDSTFHGEVNLIIHNNNKDDLVFPKGSRITSVAVIKNPNVDDIDVNFVQIRESKLSSGSSGK